MFFCRRALDTPPSSELFARIRAIEASLIADHLIDESAALKAISDLKVDVDTYLKERISSGQVKFAFGEKEKDKEKEQRVKTEKIANDW